MRSPAHDIAEYLEDQGVDTTVYVNEEPDSPDNCVTIYDTQGAEPPLQDIELYEPTIQVRVRNTDHATGYQKMREIVDLLILPTTRDLGASDDTRYIGIWATTDILSIGRDDNNRHVFTSNYRINRQPLEEST